MSEKKSPVIYKVAIMILPIGVLIGTAAFMWAYYDNHKEKENKQSIIVSGDIRAKDITDMLTKLTEDIDARLTDKEEGKRAHRQASSFIEGRLGPINTGFQIKRGDGQERGDDLWRSLWVDVRGEAKQEEVLLVATPIEGAGKAADSNLIASVMTLASSMAREKLDRTVRFVFLPLEQDSDAQTAWLLEKCISDGERCVGVIGIQEMEGEILLGASEWRIKSPNEASNQWWQSVINANSNTSRKAEDIPSVWLSHPVYSAETWKNALELRVDATVPVLIQLREWVKKAAAVE